MELDGEVREEFAALTSLKIDSSINCRSCKESNPIASTHVTCLELALVCFYLYMVYLSFF